MTEHLHDSSRWLPGESAMAPMAAHRIVRIGGPDAAAFLQGQLSNDITALDTNPGQLSSFNSPKGRVLAFLRVLKYGDTFWLVVDEAAADAFMQRLKMFVLRSKVDVGTAGELKGVAAAGPKLAERLATEELPLPAAGQAIEHDGRVLLGIPGPVPRVEIFGPADTLPAPDASADDLARWDILFRLPRIDEANRDTHVAQHLNLDELGAIHFRKGCYTGQEIIARMKYLGKVKKRPFVLEGVGAPGDTVRDDNGTSAGEIVNSAGDLLLAVLNLDALEKPLSVNDLPVQVLN